MPPTPKDAARVPDAIINGNTVSDVRADRGYVGMANFGFDKRECGGPCNASRRSPVLYVMGINGLVVHSMCADGLNVATGTCAKGQSARSETIQANPCQTLSQNDCGVDIGVPLLLYLSF